MKDIEKIPFTTKDDLRAAYPFGLFAVPYEEIVEIHASSGTSGKPTVTGYTKEDLDIWSECIARGLGMVGVEKEYILQMHSDTGYLLEDSVFTMEPKNLEQ